MYDQDFYSSLLYSNKSQSDLDLDSLHVHAAVIFCTLMIFNATFGTCLNF